MQEYERRLLLRKRESFRGAKGNLEFNGGPKSGGMAPGTSSLWGEVPGAFLFLGFVAGRRLRIVFSSLLIAGRSADATSTADRAFPRTRPVLLRPLRWSELWPRQPHRR
jgi:hypothetical protein